MADFRVTQHNAQVALDTLSDNRKDELKMQHGISRWGWGGFVIASIKHPTQVASLFSTYKSAMHELSLYKESVKSSFNQTLTFLNQGGYFDTARLHGNQEDSKDIKPGTWIGIYNAGLRSQEGASYLQFTPIMGYVISFVQLNKLVGEDALLNNVVHKNVSLANSASFRYQDATNNLQVDKQFLVANSYLSKASHLQHIQRN